jgi:hypothetical protein
LLRWDCAGAHESSALKARRQVEAELWNGAAAERQAAA